jgi:hypothetical protein
MTVPTISPLPEAPDDANDSPSTFSTKADAFVNALPTFRTEANALADFAEQAAGAVSGIGIAAFFEVELADTTDSDPGSGKLKFSNATQQNATELYIDDDDIDGTTIRDQLDKISSIQNTVKGDISLRKRDDKSKWLIYEVTDITQKTRYTAVTVQNGDGSSSSPFADEDEIVVGFTRAGEKGADGSTLGASKGFAIAMSLIF